MRPVVKASSTTTRKTSGSADTGRMVHIRLDSELHRKLRLVVAAEDTTLQEWIARTLGDAAGKAWRSIGEEQ
jgi:predicted HicB family RNase H-like nuclease